MLYPNTQPSGVVGGGQDNKKKLQQLLSRNGAAPMFGSTGRSASTQALPSIGAPALSFNPFLKMLAGHPGETLDNLPNNPLDGFVGSSVPTSSQPPNAGGPAGFQGAPNGGFVPPGQQQNPFDANGAAAAGGGAGHFNDGGPGYTGPQQGVYGDPTLSPTNPFYHTLMQLMQYGLDS